MPLFTFIMDFAGGTYISQVDAPSTTTACVKWAEELDVSGVKGIGANSKASLINQMKDEEQEPQPLNGIFNAWCTTASLRGGLALINIVRTEGIRSSDV
jgi:hypothetical protein